MSATVFANGMSIACKVSSGKTTAATPDVCLSPPAPPAGPLPIPYPNTASASDTDKGSTTVSIGGEPVMLKDQSEFKTSTGNEAATRNFGMGVVTHKIQGVATFVAWSMDVKFEGQNVPRHMDLMGHNEACNNPPNTPPWIYLDSPASPPSDHPCKEEIEKAQKSCKSSPSVGGTRKCDDAGNCQKALQCILIPKGRDKALCCDTANTGDHLIEDHWVRPGGNAMPDFQTVKSLYYGAPTMCVDGSRFTGSHGIATASRGDFENGILGQKFPYSTAKAKAIESHNDTYPKAGCKKTCLESQLDGFYGEDGNKQCQASGHKQALTKDQKQWIANKNANVSTAPVITNPF